MVTAEEKLARKFVENINGRPRRLADLDEVAIRITHVAPQFVAVVIERLGNKLSAFFGPIFIAGMNVCDAQIKEAAHAIQIVRRR